MDPSAHLTLREIHTWPHALTAATASTNLRNVEDGRLDSKRLSALAHPIRVAILEASEVEAVSPSEIAVALAEPLGVVAYHFRVLHSAGLIELESTERRRGSIQNFYRATGSGWGELVTTLREIVGDSP